jgi:hypothetical protein
MRRRTITVSVAVTLIVGILIAAQSALTVEYARPNHSSNPSPSSSSANSLDGGRGIVTSSRHSQAVMDAAATHSGTAVAHVANPSLFGLMFAVLGRYTTEVEVKQVAEALTGWIEHVVVPQRNVHIAFFYDLEGQWSTLESLVSRIGLDVFNDTHFTLPAPNRFPIRLERLPTLDVDIMQHGSSMTSSSCCYCGVPAGAYQAALEHWLSLPFFHHPLTRQYSFVIKMSPYTRFFRRPRFPLVGELQRVGATIGSVGPFHPHSQPCSFGSPPPSIAQLPPLHTSGTPQPQVGFEERFLVIRTHPFLDLTTSHNLHQYLTNHKFRYVQDGWAASHFWEIASLPVNQKAPPTAAAWSWMQWQPKTLRKNAVLYFSSTIKSIDEIKKWTRLRWSRVTREKTGY